MLTQEQIQANYDRVNAAGQFAYENNIVVTLIEPCRAEGELTVTETSFNPYRIVHGDAATEALERAPPSAAIT